MKLNENLILVGERVILVPYLAEHVPKYHEWMKSPFLQEMTASEPLTLEEEYKMQQSWHGDENKLTFIITSLPNDSTDDLKSLSIEEIKQNTVMIGDVNIFLNDPDNDLTFGEIEVMIAEPDYRKTNRGQESVTMIMGYAIKEMGLKTFHAKISLKNQPSINLFESKFNYYEIAKSEIFEEITLEWTILEPSSVPKMDEYGNEIEPYGLKATPEQRNRVKELCDTLVRYYDQNVRKAQWSQQ